MKKRMLSLLALLVILLYGCRPAASTQSPSPVVTRIMAIGNAGDFELYRYYSDSDKMRAVLLTLRALRPKTGVKSDSEELQTSMVSITMTYSDGSTKEYHLKDSRYFQEGAGEWKLVDTEKAAALWQLLWETPSDKNEQ